MSINRIWTASPSRIALPTYGRVLGIPNAQVDSRMCGSAAEGYAKRTHATTVAVARTQGLFPGSPAWRPPTG